MSLLRLQQVRELLVGAVAELGIAPRRLSIDEFLAFIARVELEQGGLAPVDVSAQVSRTRYGSGLFDVLLAPYLEAKIIPPPKRLTLSDAVRLKDILMLVRGGEDKFLVVANGVEIDIVHTLLGIVLFLFPDDLIRRAFRGGITNGEWGTWLGDVVSAAAAFWLRAPLGVFEPPSSRPEDYIRAKAADSDLLGDIDAVAITLGLPEFTFNSQEFLSTNLARYYVGSGPPLRTPPASRRRFHLFCRGAGFEINQDGVTLSELAKARIRAKLQVGSSLFTVRRGAQGRVEKFKKLFFGAKLPGLQPEGLDLGRAFQLGVFSDHFVNFVESGLRREGRR